MSRVFLPRRAEACQYVTTYSGSADASLVDDAFGASTTEFAIDDVVVVVARGRRYVFIVPDLALRDSWLNQLIIPLAKTRASDSFRHFWPIVQRALDSHQPMQIHMLPTDPEMVEKFGTLPSVCERVVWSTERVRLLVTLWLSPDGTLRTRWENGLWQPYSEPLWAKVFQEDIADRLSLRRSFLVVVSRWAKGIETDLTGVHSTILQEVASSTPLRIDGQRHDTEDDTVLLLYECALSDTFKLLEELRRSHVRLVVVGEPERTFLRRPWTPSDYHCHWLQGSEWRSYRQHAAILDICVGLSALALPPYVVLEIIDWLPTLTRLPRLTKIRLIEGVYFSARRVRSARN